VDLSVGTVVARSYEILGPLGRGGMGELFVARNVRTERRVALKMLRPDAKQRKDAIERFRREARATGMVSSDHVTQVLDVEEDPVHGIAIAFELLEGESLLEFLRRTGPMSPEAIGPVIRQILRGLADAHSAGVIHRDLKPSNIFLERRSDGSTRVKILDFGISKLPRSMVKVTLTEPNQSLGSFMFMPPEQIQGAKDVDERADIYAMGTLIFQSLTGQLPFASNGVAELVRIKNGGRARSLRDASGRVFPDRLEAFVQKCLESDRTRRFQTALEMIAAWDHVTGNGGGYAAPHPGGYGAAPAPAPSAGAGQGQTKQQPVLTGREDMAQTLAMPASVRGAYPLPSPQQYGSGQEQPPAGYPAAAALPVTTVHPIVPEQPAAAAYNPYAAAGYGQAATPAPPPPAGYGYHGHPNGAAAAPQQPPGFGPAASAMATPLPYAGQPPVASPGNYHPALAQAIPPGFAPAAPTQPQLPPQALPPAQLSPPLQAPAEGSSWGPPWLIALVAILVVAAIAVVIAVVYTATGQ
jgi:eukaryotic-like serine/threonine-protein kinase